MTDDQRSEDPAERLVRLFEFVFEYVDRVEWKLLKRLHEIDEIGRDLEQLHRDEVDDRAKLQERIQELHERIRLLEEPPSRPATLTLASSKKRRRS
jgi:hypothetical protein